MTLTSASPPPAEAAPPRPRARPRRPDRSAYALLLPALVPVVLFSIAPLVYGMFLAFTDARAGRDVDTSFVFLENFGHLLADVQFWSSFRIGLVWAVTVTLLQYAAGMGLALLLNQNLRLRWLARTLALFPWAMPPVIVGLMWRLVYHPDAGVLNAALTDLGLISENIDWLNDFGWALPAVVVVGVWTGMPQTTIVLLAGLQNVSRDLGEAARVDGAGPWRRFTAVTLPQLRTVTVAITSLNFVWNMNEFALVYVLTQGGPGGMTRLPMLYAYEEAFRYGFFGYASAMGVAIVIVVLAVLGFYLRRQLKEAEA
ncbi:carbohydrate ABC transporter permease [Streptomonospora nanhaiensis]|uniref:Multiple sugar transport system permease protein n=1 Tax=Streptomonospora nanhaiensis TaxID=1323731 RepID=A0A853BL17_9ACTN|nr:sugar ABC transporter permease [Streptomonospora nanhaiensis]MBV2361949.1 sugar ABC transporter permease [Streptomonospora nanhaiensis]MBX9391633.1 sugar ABC transporter permease [Streptomonospora nanhaiensis]NYI96229.1 multiple sugar transport system permease protein [Streptomonospora nanhaiensis]